MRPAPAAALAVLLAGSAALAQSFETDAMNAGRGGLWVLGRLEKSPGSPSRDIAAIAFDVARPYVGTEITAAALRVQLACGSARIALALGQLCTPVGRESAASTALQLGSGNWRLGASLAVRSLRFEGETGERQLLARLGAGLESSPRGMAVAVLESSPSGGGLPQLGLGARLAFVPGIEIGLQIVRQPGLGSTARCGFTWSTDGLDWQAGYDATTQACSFGIVWTWGRQQLAWAARTHPDLGWSHWCTYARQR